MFGTFRYAWFLNKVVSAPTNFVLGSDINGGAAEDLSGWSVSLNAAGDRVAIGAPGNDGNGSSSGHTRIYQWNGTTSTWDQMGSDINGEAAEDESGYSVSLNADGDRVAIGAMGNDGTGALAGHTRIYQWNGITSTWDQMGSDIDGEAAGDRSGASVSLNAAGDRVAIGATSNDGNGSSSGHTRIYQWNGITSTWDQMGSDIDGEAVVDLSGWSVSLNAVGDRVAIGAPYHAVWDNSGHTRIYQWDGTTSTWDQMGSNINGEATGDLSGWSVSLNAAGDRVAIGAPGNDGNGSSSGHTRIYQWNGTNSTWDQLGPNINGEAVNDQSGWSVSLNAVGDRVAIGAAMRTEGAAALLNVSNLGRTRIYQWDGTTSTWDQMGSDIDGEAIDDRSGYSVSLNAAGDRVAIGAPYNDGNGVRSGHTRIYQI